MVAEFEMPTQLDIHWYTSNLQKFTIIYALTLIFHIFITLLNSNLLTMLIILWADAFASII